MSTFGWQVGLHKNQLADARNWGLLAHFYQNGLPVCGAPPGDRTKRPGRQQHCQRCLAALDAGPGVLQP